MKRRGADSSRTCTVTSSSRAHVHASLSLHQPAPDALEVVVREDAVFVGHERLSLQFSECEEPHLGEEWLEFACDNDYTALHFFPIPVPAGARANAVWAVDHFRRAVAEPARLLAAAHAASTTPNRLRKLVEAHFILFVLLLFFVLLPGVVLLVVYLHSLWSGATG